MEPCVSCNRAETAAATRLATCYTLQAESGVWSMAVTCRSIILVSKAERCGKPLGLLTKCTYSKKCTEDIYVTA